MDHHLSHLAGIIYTDYEVYSDGYWKLAQVWEGYPISPGEFLIYRPCGSQDEHGLGLAALIRRCHETQANANPFYHHTPVLAEYRTG